MIEHTDGEAIWMKSRGWALENFMIKGGVTRAAAAFDVQQPGIRIEGEDIAFANTAQGAKLVSVASTGHPGAGIIVSGEATRILSLDNRVYKNKGHGFCIDPGDRTGRTFSDDRPGIINLINLFSARNGGHALAIGSPATTPAGLPYRINIEMLECFGNADDAAVRYSDYAVYLYAYHLNMINSAISGQTSASVLDVHGALYAAGSPIRLTNNRFIFSSTGVRIGQRDIQTENCVIEDAWFVNDAVVLNPAIVVEAGAIVKVRNPSEAAGAVHFSDLITTSNTEPMTIELDGDVRHLRANFQAGAIRTENNVFMADDAFKKLSFTFTTHAEFLIEISSSSGIGGKFAVRIGSSPYCEAIGASAAFQVGTGALTDGTSDGTDGKFNVFAHSDGLYLKNRLAVSATAAFTISALRHDARYLGVA
jgi:hypothetical protein